jgi:hypothetical protein
MLKIDMTDRNYPDERDTFSEPGNMNYSYRHFSTAMPDTC